MQLKRLGVIAGNGEFPLLFLSQAKLQNIDAVIIALKGEADDRIKKFGYPVHWINIGHLGDLIKTFKNESIDKAVMVGQVVHTRLFTEVKLDFKAITLLAGLKNKKTDTILSAVADEIGKHGVELISSIIFMENWLPSKKGVLTKHSPDKRITEDIKLGYEIAKQIAGLDIGQTVVVKDGAIVAVESLEGTDEAIRRGYELAGKGIVVVKVNKPKQDMRFDVPVIGFRTFETLIETQASAIAFEAGKTLFFNAEKVIELANKNKIIVYAM